MRLVVDQPAIAYPIETIPLIAGVTRTQIFQAIKDNELTARKKGRRTIIEVDELRRWISTFPTKGRAFNNAARLP
ncbi:MAG TPA: DNA-binding protein [Pseudolabrys sp.]|nr:DNA-binding protein [Pseudolabrys sp.]